MVAAQINQLLQLEGRHYSFRQRVLYPQILILMPYGLWNAALHVTY